MDDPSDPSEPAWRGTPTSKSRNAAQRAVTALLDELAPERVLKRADETPLIVEQHRTPTGCVLQAPQAALSVSWFVDTGNEPTLGELHIVVWKGRLQMRGTPRKVKGATIVSEIMLHPFDCLAGECKWRSSDGREFDTPGLAAHCVELLEAQRGTDA